MDVPLPTRLFSLREANALLETLREAFTRARGLRDQLADVQKKLSDAGHPLEDPEIQIDTDAPADVQRLQARAALVLGKMRDVLREVAELGVEVKAADGLVDFRSKLNGRTVYLCWKFGEDRVTHWHEMDAGFAGRKPIEIESDFTGDFLH